MAKMNRRDFVVCSAGVAAGGLALGAVARASESKEAAAVTRTLGKTGLSTSRLGIGTGTKSWNKDSDQIRQGRTAFIKVLRHAYDRGLRYYDMADLYGSHFYFREAMRDGKFERDQLTLLSKLWCREAPLVKDSIDRIRQELHTDYVDILLMHCIRQGGWEAEFAPTLEVMAQAKAEGKIRAVGVSCHDFQALKEAAVSPWVDVILARVNPFGIKMDARTDEVVPVLKQAHDAGKGILGMKILGEGQCADRIDESLKFVLGLDCVDAINIGFMTPEQVDDAMARMAKYA